MFARFPRADTRSKIVGADVLEMKGRKEGRHGAERDVFHSAGAVGFGSGSPEAGNSSRASALRVALHAEFFSED